MRGPGKLTTDQKAELVRRGALELGRRFAGRFAARFDGDGLGPRAAAEEAIVDLARDGLRALLGLGPAGRPLARRNRKAPARRLAPPPPPLQDRKKPRPTAKRGGRAADSPAVPDPLARLKRSIVPGGDRTG
jgi:hypothetical protein